MNARARNFALLAVSPALALAACSPASDGADASEADAASGEAAAQAPSALPLSESGWLTVGSDGAVQTTFFDANGRYRDLRNGVELAGGSWEQRTDGTICFEPDAGLGACWETMAPDENGTAIATNADGKSIAIKQVTYIAPPQSEDSEAETD